MTAADRTSPPPRTAELPTDLERLRGELARRERDTENLRHEKGRLQRKSNRLQRENDRLKQENERLKRQLARHAGQVAAKPRRSPRTGRKVAAGVPDGEPVRRMAATAAGRARRRSTKPTRRRFRGNVRTAAARSP